MMENTSDIWELILRVFRIFNQNFDLKMTLDLKEYPKIIDFVIVYFRIMLLET